MLFSFHFSTIYIIYLTLGHVLRVKLDQFNFLIFQFVLNNNTIFFYIKNMPNFFAQSIDPVWK